MSVTAVIPQASGRSGGADDKGLREYTRTFKVLTDNPQDGTVAILAAAGIPAKWSPYNTTTEQDLGSLCRKIRCTQEGNEPKSWIVTAEYSSKASEQDENPEDPLAAPAKFSGNFAQFQKAIERDLAGNAILNSAGQKFENPTEVDDSRPAFTIEKNFATMNMLTLFGYRDSVNSAVYLGFPIGTLKLGAITFSRQFGNATIYFPHSFTFQYDEDGWLITPLNVGFNEKVVESLGPPVVYKLRKCVDPDTKQPYSSPVMLDANGLATPSGPPTFQSFVGYRTRDFNLLGLI